MMRLWDGRIAGQRGHARALLLAVCCTVTGLPGSVRAAAPRAAPVAGVYLLTEAAGDDLPYQFSFDMGRTVHGQVLGARLVLQPNGAYSSDVTVRMNWGDAIPIPGLSSGNEDRVLHGGGRYAASGDAVVLSPSDWLSKRVVTRVLARTDGHRMVLTAADRPPDGQRYPVAAAFTKVSQ
jgi:hypothetical protein